MAGWTASLSATQTCHPSLFGCLSRLLLSQHTQMHTLNVKTILVRTQFDRIVGFFAIFHCFPSFILIIITTFIKLIPEISKTAML